jgi:hypothetical protein
MKNKCASWLLKKFKFTDYSPSLFSISAVTTKDRKVSNLGERRVAVELTRPKFSPRPTGTN